MSNSITVSGKVHKVGEVQQITEKFSKRQLVLDTGDKYSPFLPIDFAGKNLNAPSALQVGQEVTIHINLGGREAKDGRFWPDISGWKVDAENINELNEDSLPPAEDDDSIPF